MIGSGAVNLSLGASWTKVRQAENDEDLWWTITERVLSRSPLILSFSRHF